MKLDNPYLKEYEHARALGSVRYDPSAERIRKDLVQKYAWAVPDDEAIEAMATYSPLVEMGAGNGYWAWLLRQANVEVMAFDGFESGGFGYVQGETWTPVEPGGPSTLLEFGPEWNLFLCWPPYRDPFGYECLLNFNGKYVIYVGEDSYGCTGDGYFHLALRKAFDHITYVNIPSWDGLADRLHIYKKLKLPAPMEDLMEKWVADQLEDQGGTTYPYDFENKPRRKNPLDDLEARNLLVGRLGLEE